MRAIDRLFEHEPFDYSAEGLRLQLEAFQEAFRLQYEGCVEYRRLCDHRGFRPGDLARREQLRDIPAIFVGVLKERDLLSVPAERVARTFTSSGTGGRVSRICLDQPSFDRVVRSARNVYAALGMVAPEQEVNYLCFSYDPAKAAEVGTSFTDDLLTSFTRRHDVFFTLRWDDKLGEFAFDREGSLERLEQYERQGLPTRLLGFPAFIHDLLEEGVARRGKSFALPPGSWVLTGGGWKGRADEAISKRGFAAQVAGWLGIPQANVRDLYGMVEHGIPYVDCARQNLHVPLYAHVTARSPATMEASGEGEPGLLEFRTPYLTSYPSYSLLTTDLGRLHAGCECGVAGPVVELLGRGGVKKHKGCALTAAELYLGSREAKR